MVNRLMEISAQCIVAVNGKFHVGYVERNTAIIVIPLFSPFPKLYNFWDMLVIYLHIFRWWFERFILPLFDFISPSKTSNFCQPLKCYFGINGWLSFFFTMPGLPKIFSSFNTPCVVYSPSLLTDLKILEGNRRAFTFFMILFQDSAVLLQNSSRCWVQNPLPCMKWIKITMEI